MASDKNSTIDGLEYNILGYETKQLNELAKDAKSRDDKKSSPASSKKTDVGDKSSSTSNEIKKNNPLNDFAKFVNLIVKFGRDVQKLFELFKKGLDIWNNRDQYIKNILDFSDEAAALNEKIGKIMSDAGFDPSVTEFVQKQVSKNANRLSEAAFTAYKTADAFLTDLGKQFLSWLRGSVYLDQKIVLSFIKTYLDSMNGKGYSDDYSGKKKWKEVVDPRAGGDYIREMAIRTDSDLILEWYDKRFGFGYNRYGGYAESTLSKSTRSGSFKITSYILKKLNTEYLKSMNIQNTTTVDRLKEEAYEDCLFYRKLIEKAIKDTIVYSYSNLTLEEYIRLFARPYSFLPRDMGDKPTYNKNIQITMEDIDTLAPKFIIRNDTSIDKSIRNVYGNDQYPYKNDSVYIDPRNLNIKKIYVYLANTVIYPTDYLVHQELHKRLKYPIVTTLQKSYKAAFEELDSRLPSGAIGDLAYTIKNSLYEMVKKMEPLMFAPSLQGDLSKGKYDFDIDGTGNVITEDDRLVPDFENLYNVDMKNYKPPILPFKGFENFDYYNDYKVIKYENEEQMNLEIFKIGSDNKYKYFYKFISVDDGNTYYIFTKVDLGENSEEIKVDLGENSEEILKYLFTFFMLLKMSYDDFIALYQSLIHYANFYKLYFDYLKSLKEGNDNIPDEYQNLTTEDILNNFSKFYGTDDIDIDSEHSKQMVTRIHLMCSNKITSGLSTRLFNQWDYEFDS